MSDTDRVDATQLVPPVQMIVRCTECDFERTTLALHPGAVEAARRCERCSEPTRILAYRPMHSGCSCCAL